MDTDDKSYEALFESLIDDSELEPDTAPLWESLASAGEIFKRVAARDDDSPPPDIDTITEVLSAGLMLCEHSRFKNMALKSFAVALNEIRDLAEENPDIATRLIGAVFGLVVGYQGVVTGNSMTRLGNFADRVGPIARLNAEKAAVTDRAKAIAKERWADDIRQSVRIGEMADLVYRQLATEGYIDALPGSSERVKDWLKSVAPEYSRKPGRSRKRLKP